MKITLSYLRILFCFTAICCFIPSCKQENKKDSQQNIEKNIEKTNNTEKEKTTVSKILKNEDLNATNSKSTIVLEDEIVQQIFQHYLYCKKYLVNADAKNAQQEFLKVNALLKDEILNSFRVKFSFTEIFSSLTSAEIVSTSLSISILKSSPNTFAKTPRERSSRRSTPGAFCANFQISS